MGCHALLQGTFWTQGSNPCLLHCRWILHRWGPREPLVPLKKQNLMRDHSTEGSRCYKEDCAGLTVFCSMAQGVRLSELSCSPLRMGVGEGTYRTFREAAGPLPRSRYSNRCPLGRSGSLKCLKVAASKKKRVMMSLGPGGPEGDHELPVLEDALTAQETLCTAGPQEATLQAGCL